MNIFALKGYKVKVTKKSANQGHDSDKKNIAEKLRIGKIYTVKRTEVHNSSTSVYLQEVEGVFNSVNFEEVTKQPKELNVNHHDFHKYY